MGVINSLLCLDQSENQIDFSAQTIPIGSFISATADSNIDITQNEYFCFQIINVDIPLGNYTASTNINYTSCYDCMVDNYTIVTLTSCSSSTNFIIDITQLGYVPIINVTTISATIIGGRGDETGCFTVTDVEQVSENEYNAGLGDLSTITNLQFDNYRSCDECLYGFSSGTESTICVVCCPCTTGETVTSVVPPHPTWTNGQGQAITQLNAITLGGPNGLNN